ncbi:tyrosine recombinase XerC [Mycobacterium sp. 852014-52144_SCH5372336]|uniref:site-specific integrase n=1 Tax=Mycobacterium sp. 852014-52144_SCH5372336 TaxID=1834115 RepID=UPI0008024966|nr:site-specific integrase [Mycobacterium sp. 852014-52144_SCH5372336]OBB71576.1 integrase [Mycobacterium sp. 852014-52144_SCH5372336]
MAGRPRLRIGQHGRINRSYLGAGVWEASCRFRDSDGVVRKVQRLGPADEFDKRGKLAEDALIEALAERRAPSADQIDHDTLLVSLVDQHLTRLTEDGRSPSTIDTYQFAAGKLAKFIGGVRVGEASTARLDAALRSMRAAHGATMAKQAKTVLRGGLQLAVLANVLTANPVRDVAPLQSKNQPKGAAAIGADRLPELLAKLRASMFCREHDLVDPVTMLIATGLRRSELLGLRWADIDAKAGTVAVNGKLVRIAGEGLRWIPVTKSAAGRRTIPLPRFAIEMLTDRRGVPYLGEQPMIFPSTAGTWRDPNNFGKQWRNAREDLGVPEVTTHSFRKTAADLIDDEGLSARVGADHLGHSNVSMTQDKYMSRGRIHAEVADLLDRAVINAE